jgi:ketosteroid isomerase-like protein
MKQPVVWILIYGWLGTALLQAQELNTASEDPVHDELRALRDGMFDAFQKKDIERMLTYLHKDVVVTYQNAEVSRRHAGVRDFHRRMNEGENRAVKSLESVFKVDELSIIYGDDTAVAFGSMEDEFELTSGMDFSLKSRWTATLVKEDGRWLVAALHASTNMFDNGVMNLLIKWNSIKVGAIALLMGLVLGLIVPKLVTRVRKRNE